MPTTTVPAASTYQAPFRIKDLDGSALDLSDASVEYLISERSDGRGELFSVDETDNAVEVEPGAQTGELVVTILADEVEWTGNVFEELRVEIGVESLVVSQRAVRFEPVGTAPRVSP